MSGKWVQVVPELTGRELDAAVAEKVMGWRRKHNGMMHGTPQEVFVDDGDNTYSIACGCAEDFNPSESIESAMLVVEKIREWSVKFWRSRSEGKWIVTFVRLDHKHEAVSTSLPEAICRAALTAVGDQPSVRVEPESDREPVIGDDGGSHVSFSEPCATVVR